VVDNWSIISTALATLQVHDWAKILRLQLFNAQG